VPRNNEMNNTDDRGSFLVPAIAVASTALVLRIAHIILTEKYDPLASSLVLDAKIYVRWAEAVISHGSAPSTLLMQAPLYPWFLAAVFKLLGAGILKVKIIQALMGTASCTLTAAITARLFRSTPAGLLAGLILALYKPLIFYEGVLVPATLLTFLLSVSLWLMYMDEPFKNRVDSRDARSATGHTEGRRVIPFISGMILGLAAIAKPTAILIAPFGLLHYYHAGKSKAPAYQPSAKLITIAGRKLIPYVLGLVVALTPLTIRNYMISGEFIPLTTGGGINFYIGHNPSANGYYAVPTFNGRSLGATPDEQWVRMHLTASKKMGRKLGPAEVSSFWFKEGIKFIRRHPRRELSLLWGKFLFLLNSYERANVENIYFHARFPGLLQLPLLNFGILAPIAVIGIFLTARHRSKLWPLYGGVVTYSLSSLAFYVLARYRLPIVIFLAPFAGAGVIELIKIIRNRERAAVALSAIALPALFYLSNMKVATDSETSIANNLVRLGKVYIKDGDYEKALESFREALEIDPANKTALEGIDLIDGKSRNQK